MSKEALDAVDVLNWDYLCEIAGHLDGERAKDAEAALRGFAYAFTSTASEEVRNRMLRDILFNATCLGTRWQAEQFIVWLADRLRSDRTMLRQFAKENGIRLQRG